jgi:hypothetical protein
MQHSNAASRQGMTHHSNKRMLGKNADDLAKHTADKFNANLKAQFLRYTTHCNNDAATHPEQQHDAASSLRCC